MGKVQNKPLSFISGCTRNDRMRYPLAVDDHKECNIHFERRKTASLTMLQCFSMMRFCQLSAYANILSALFE